MTKKREKFKDWLEKKGACRDFVAWAGVMSRDEAWRKLENPEWMIWLLRKEKRTPKRVFVRLACMFASRVLHLTPPSETYPRLAIEAAERWIKTPSEKNKEAATVFAKGPAWAAALSARDAAWAAGAEADRDIDILDTLAALAGRSASYARDAAWAAGQVTGADGKGSAAAERIKQCEIIREVIKNGK